MNDDQTLIDQALIDEGIAAAEKITEADRVLYGATRPIIEDGHVVFFDNDRRFHIHPTTIIYIDEYLKENRLTLEQACQGERHVRELIEIITS